jgi:hypothetical protein
MCQSILSRITKRRCRQVSSSSSDGSSIPLATNLTGFVFTAIPITKFSELMAGEVFFANFGNISLRVPGSSSLAPGQVHRWNQKPRITGPMICFTQECKGTAAQLPARTSFWFSFETLQLLTTAKGDAATFDLL